MRRWMGNSRVDCMHRVWPQRPRSNGKQAGKYRASRVVEGAVKELRRVEIGMSETFFLNIRAKYIKILSKHWWEKSSDAKLQRVKQEESRGVRNVFLTLEVFLDVRIGAMIRPTGSTENLGVRREGCRIVDGGKKNTGTWRLRRPEIFLKSGVFWMK